MENSFVKADRLRLSSHPALNDAWLRDRIAEDPSVLGLGGLQLAGEGRFRDGRLELVLHDAENARRFAVVIRVGPADEADLLQAIVHWTSERENVRGPEHFAVLVAETFPPRVLAAATTLGVMIPLTALQVSALRIGEHVALDFTRVIDRVPTRYPESVNGNGNGDATRSAHGSLALPATALARVSPDAVFSSNTIGGVLDAMTAPLPPAHHETYEGEVSEPALTATTTMTTTPTAPLPVPPAFREDRLAGTFITTPSPQPRPRVRHIHLFAMSWRLSLLLCVAAGVGWLRSYSVRDVYTFPEEHDRDHVISSDHGHIDWVSPRSNGGGEQQYVRIPYWLPLSITAILPAAWVIRRAGRVAG